VVSLEPDGPIDVEGLLRDDAVPALGLGLGLTVRYSAVRVDSTWMFWEPSGHVEDHTINQYQHLPGKRAEFALKLR